MHTRVQTQVNGDDEAMLSRMLVMNHARENVLQVCACAWVSARVRVCVCVCVCVCV